jgi:cytochrome P450
MTASSVDTIDFTDLDNFATGFPHHLFAVHRRDKPVFWHEPTEHTPGGEGFWSVASYHDVLEVLLDPVTYSSERGGDRAYGGTLLEDSYAAGLVLNMTDDPRHSRVRRLVSSGLTPRTINRIEDEVRSRTGRLLAAVPEGEPFDFVSAVATELPMQMICTLLGVPEEDRHSLFKAVEPLFDIRDQQRGSSDDSEAQAELARMADYGRALIASKRENPDDDMLSIIVHATLDDTDPPRMQADELLFFFSLLFSAGSETTRNAIAGGLLELTRYPEQLAALRNDYSLLPDAIEEMVRWTSPSPSKRRTATRSCELAGYEISAGDKVLIWEGSANRDETIFVDADRFDILRSPNPHLGFGRGVHFCLGASLARLEMRTFFEELFATFDDIAAVEPPKWTRSNRHTGIRELILRMRRGTR